MNDIQIIINCGGAGTRLWPVSTATKPKQFAPLFDGKSLFQLTIQRLLARFDITNIWIQTNVNYRHFVEAQVPVNFDSSHILTEPNKRDTLPAILLSTGLITAKMDSPDQTLVFLPSDHYIPESDWDNFNNGIEYAHASIQSKSHHITLAGLKPSFPSTALGYIQLDPTDNSDVFDSVQSLVSFVEKPNLERAKEFFESGKYLWNMGMFAFSYNTLIEASKDIIPQDINILQNLVADSDNYETYFDSFNATSFDFGILDHLSDLGIIGLDIEWSDVGTWDMLMKTLPSAPCLEISSESNSVFAPQETRVALIGVTNLIVVQDGPHILILNRDNAAEVKNIDSMI